MVFRPIPDPTIIPGARSATLVVVVRKLPSFLWLLSTTSPLLGHRKQPPTLRRTGGGVSVIEAVAVVVEAVAAVGIQAGVYIVHLIIPFHRRNQFFP